MTKTVTKSLIATPFAQVHNGLERTISEQDVHTHRGPLSGPVTGQEKGHEIWQQNTWSGVLCHFLARLDTLLFDFLFFYF